MMPRRAVDTRPGPRENSRSCTERAAGSPAGSNSTVTGFAFTAASLQLNQPQGNCPLHYIPIPRPDFPLPETPCRARLFNHSQRPEAINDSTVKQDVLLLMTAFVALHQCPDINMPHQAFPPTDILLDFISMSQGVPGSPCWCEQGAIQSKPTAFVSL